jgi:hypothetical protein
MGLIKTMLFDPRARRSGVVPGFVLQTLLGVAVAAGCDSASPGATAPDADAVCPATVASAGGQPCGLEGLRCYPEYACGILSAIATCTCSRGHFSCTDVTGSALDADATPACPTPRDGGACPATRSAADVASCTETGLLCAYPSRCPSSRGYDRCECFPEPAGDGGVRLRFHCSEPCVDGSAIVVDAADDAPPDAPNEAGSPGADASADARPRDAAAD